MGRDKARLEVEGEPLALRAAAILATVADPVLLAPGRPGRLGPVPYEEVADLVPDGGPLSGMVAGLEASPQRLLAVVAADMPRASPRLLVLLAGALDEGAWEAAVPATREGLQPLHAVYSREALPALAAALRSGTLALHQALEAVRVLVVEEERWRAADPTGRFADNVNQPGDLALLG
jgi:molybdopterin-guanine dinucleotide biosynthesis protein A